MVTNRGSFERTFGCSPSTLLFMTIIESRSSTHHKINRVLGQGRNNITTEVFILHVYGMTIVISFVSK